MTPVDHTANPCSHILTAGKRRGQQCRYWAGVTIDGMKYCDRHALAAALARLPAFHAILEEKAARDARIKELEAALREIGRVTSGEDGVNYSEDLDACYDIAREALHPSPTPLKK